jgi:sigma-B regulation protein RsbU (phosphoserine phosphatase)
MSSTRAYLRALAMAGMQIDELLKLTNRALSCDLDDSRFVTLLYARISPDRLSFDYTSAGHTTGYILDAEGRVKSVLESTAMPLGIFADGEFPAAEHRITLMPGDLLFFFTDGVTEAAALDGTIFGEARALQVLRDNRQRTSRELVEILYNAVADFVGRPVLDDDHTTIIIKVLSAA